MPPRIPKLHETIHVTVSIQDRSEVIRETITVNVVSGTTIRKLKKAIAAQCSVFVSEEARRAAASRAEVLVSGAVLADTEKVVRTRFGNVANVSFKADDACFPPKEAPIDPDSLEVIPEPGSRLELSGEPVVVCGTPEWPIRVQMVPILPRIGTAPPAGGITTSTNFEELFDSLQEILGTSVVLDDVAVAGHADDEWDFGPDEEITVARMAERCHLEGGITFVLTYEVDDGPFHSDSNSTVSTETDASEPNTDPSISDGSEGSSSDSSSSDDSSNSDGEEHGTHFIHDPPSECDSDESEAGFGNLFD